jgi:hypothetical protein
MSRRTVSADSSLELLLDTICNTFGGVLFIAILVSVLLRMTVKVVDSDSQTESSSHEALELSRQKESLLAEVNGLEQARLQQLDTRSRFARPETADLFADLIRYRAERDRLADERARGKSEVTAIRDATEKMNTAAQAASRSIEEARKIAIQSDQELSSELKSRTQTASLPKVRVSFKQEVGIFVRYGRMYFSRKYDRSGERLGPNFDDFIYLKDDLLQLTLTPKPYAGTSITSTDASAAIASQLTRFDTNRKYLAVIVWDDSFDEFQRLKKIIIDQGFEYRLIPNREGESVIEGSIERSEVQ